MKLSIFSILCSLAIDYAFAVRSRAAAREKSKKPVPQEIRGILYLPTTKSTLPISIDIHNEQDYNGFINSLLQSRLSQRLPSTAWSQTKKSTNDRQKTKTLKRTNRKDKKKTRRPKQVLSELLYPLEEFQSKPTSSTSSDETSDAYEVIRVVRMGGKDKLTKHKK